MNWSIPENMTDEEAYNFLKTACEERGGILSDTYYKPETELYAHSIHGICKVAC